MIIVEIVNVIGILLRNVEFLSYFEWLGILFYCILKGFLYFYNIFNLLSGLIYLIVIIIFINYV